MQWEFFPTQYRHPLAGEGERASDYPGGVKWEANPGVVPITRTADVAVEAYPKRPAALPVVPGDAMGEGGGEGDEL